MFPGFTILSVTLKGDVIRHYLWWNRKCYLWISIKTLNHHQSWLQFSLSHHTLQHTNSITNPLLSQINETLRQTVASCTNILAGSGGGLGYFHTYVGSDHFWGFKIFQFQYLFLDFLVYIYIYIYIPPHTHHVCLSEQGFGAHRICACADPDFHFLRLLISQRGPYA